MLVVSVESIFTASRSQKPLLKLQLCVASADPQKSRLTTVFEILSRSGSI